MHHQRSQLEKRRDPVLLTVREVAKVLQVSIASVYAIVAEGRIACHRVGTGRGSIRIEEKDLDDYLLACRTERAEKAPPPSRPRLKHIRV